MMGSHLDTQPKGGRFDGIYGVLAGLEVIRTLNDKQIITEQPLEIAVWTNEEGARFTPAMLGSAVFTGALALEKRWISPTATGSAFVSRSPISAMPGIRRWPARSMPTTRRISNRDRCWKRRAFPSAW